MDTPACIRLPYMRPAMQGGIACSRTLWPGHEGRLPEEAWQPENYPLGPHAASLFLKSLQNLTCTELEAMRHAWTARDFCSAVSESDELRALGEFTGKPGLRGAYNAALELAQQLLLWSWQQEQTLGDLEALERECLLKEEAISRHFLETGEDAYAPTPQSANVGLAWRPVAANAAFFISPEQAILAEGGMGADLVEILEFRPADSRAFAVRQGRLRQARAPLWRVLGYSRLATGEAARIYNPERLWLIWSEG